MYANVSHITSRRGGTPRVVYYNPGPVWREDHPADRGAAPALPRGPREARHVLSNLIGNAVKFTRDRDPARITVLATERDGKTVYQVRDNGVGFPSERAAEVFNDFTRLHDARQFEGSGIGLALVRRIVERHGGRVWAESEVDRGSPFSFTLGPAAA